MRRRAHNDASGEEAVYPWDREARKANASLGYLLTPVAEARQALAAYYIRGCSTVVEIGGYKAPITKFLIDVPERVLVIDPKVDPFQARSLYGYPCEVAHLPTRLHRLDPPPVLARGEYALVLLGFSPKFPDLDAEGEVAAWRQIIELVAGARRTILEYALDNANGVAGAERLFAALDRARPVDITLDATRSPGIHPDYARRRFVVLDPPAA